MVRLVSVSIIALLTVVLWGCRYQKELGMHSARYEHAVFDLSFFDENTKCITKKLTLDEIIEIAINNDLDLEVKRQRIRVQREIATAEALNMLPDLIFDGEFSKRDNSPAATSLNLEPPHSPLSPPSISSDKTSLFGNVSLIWNLLDFGLSFYTARQTAHQINIDYLEYERAKQNLILRVVRAYWKAASSYNAIITAIPLVQELRAQRELLKDQISEGIYLSDIDAYSKLARFYQREIQLKGFNDRNDSSDPTQGYEKEYENALADLGSFMGVRPGFHFEVVFDFQDLPFEVVIPSEEELEGMALMYRPELYQNDTQLLITRDDVRKALLQQFPALSFFDTAFYDRNTFLVNHTWLLAGIELTWNLLKTPHYFFEQRRFEKEVGFVKRERLFLSMGIIVQVNLGRILSDQNKEQYLLVRNTSYAQEKLTDIVHRQALLGKKSESDDLNARVDAALAKVNAMKVYAELQNSLETLNNAVGMPRYYKLTYQKEGP